MSIIRIRKDPNSKFIPAMLPEEKFSNTAFEKANYSNARGHVYYPLFLDRKLKLLGFLPFLKGESAKISIVQADHEEYKEWSNKNISGIELIMDERNEIGRMFWKSRCKLLKLGNKC